MIKVTEDEGTSECAFAEAAALVAIGFIRAEKEGLNSGQELLDFLSCMRGLMEDRHWKQVAGD